MNERELLQRFIEAKQRVAQMEETLKDLKAQRDEAQQALVDYLDANQASATRKYDGLGWAQINAPTLYASLPVEHQPEAFAWLRAHDHAAAVKETVHSATLSQIVSECVKRGEELPPHVTYFLKPNVRLYGGSNGE